MATGKPSPIEIKEALVEDNFDYAMKKDAPDHLELLLKNKGTRTLNDITVKYQIRTINGSDTESYITKLTGLELAPGQEQRVHFDDSHKPGHYRTNPNSIYKIDTAEKMFSVLVDIDGYRSVTKLIHKDAGGAEKAD